MRESHFQSSLIKELKTLFPGCYVLKNDACYMQGIPDLLILWKNHWAMLEVKASAKAAHRPNQDIHVARLNQMSFAAFIYPENKEAVLHELQLAFGLKARSRVSKSIPAKLAELHRRAA